METASVEETIKPGTKCKVWGRKSSVESGKIKYYAKEIDGSHYFMNKKKDAVISGESGYMGGFFGANTSLENWSNFQVIEE